MIRAIFFALLMGFTIISSAFISTAQAAESKTVTLDIPGMTCGLCPVTIRRALGKVSGVVEASTSLKTQTATVTFDPTKTNVGALTKATKNAGYPATLRQ